MIIEVNKDIDKYQESVVLGLTARQLIYSLASVLVGGGMVLLLYRYIGLTGAAYVTIPCVAPIAMGGFYSYNGMNFYQYMGRRIHFMFGNRPLTYISTESEAELTKLANEGVAVKKGMFGFGESVEKNKKDPKEQHNKEEFEAVKRKMKLLIITVVLCIIAAVAALIVKRYVM